jgi:hypothetical protein
MDAAATCRSAFRKPTARSVPIMKNLEISSTLSLPIDAVTQKLAMLGRTGSGKSYAATKLAEEMLDAGAQIVALDPVGIWYGLRTGYSIPVFGGLHGDIPLEVGGGALIADLIVDRRISAVVDVSQFESDADKARFARDFAARFYFRQKQKPSPVHLFLEEAQEFVRRIQKRKKAECFMPSSGSEARAQLRNRYDAALAATAGSKQKGAESDGMPLRVSNDRTAGTRHDREMGNVEGRRRESRRNSSRLGSGTGTCLVSAMASHFPHG